MSYRTRLFSNCFGLGFRRRVLDDCVGCGVGSSMRTDLLLLFVGVVDVEVVVVAVVFVDPCLSVPLLVF